MNRHGRSIAEAYDRPAMTASSWGGTRSSRTQRLRRRDPDGAAPRARGRGGNGEDDALAGGLERAWASGCACSRRSRPRARRRSRSPVSAICSIPCSTRRWHRFRPDSARRCARARSRGGRGAGARRACGRGRAPQRAPRRSRATVSCSSQSTTCSGSMRRLLRRSRMRRGDSEASTSASCSRAARVSRARCWTSCGGRSAPSGIATSTSARSISRALHQVVAEHLGVALPRPLLAEVHQASGGNPFYALEIVRTLTRSGVSVEAGSRFRCPTRSTTSSTVVCSPFRPRARDFLTRRRRACASDGLDHGDGIRRRASRRPRCLRSRLASSSSKAIGSASRTRCSPRAR